MSKIVNLFGGSIIWIEKVNAGIEYCSKNNMIYKITNIPPLSDIEFRELIDSNQIKLTERYNKKYEETYGNKNS